MIKIFILILNFNGARSTIELFDSLSILNTPKGTEIEKIIIDNGSVDDSVNRMKDKLPNEILLETGKNLGFTGGNNFGMKYAINNGADYIMILNNDTRVSRDMIINLYKTINSDENIAGILPKIYFEKGFEFHNNRYKENEKGKVIWYAGGTIDWQNLIGKNIGVDEVDMGQYDNQKKVDLATGCCLLLRAEVLKKIGFFNDKYFLYYEDADLSERIKRAGYKIIYEPKAVMWHKNAESSGGSGSILQDYYITRNRLLFGMKYAPLRTKLALIKESLNLLKDGRKWQKKGVIDFYLGKLGRGSFKI